MGITKSLSSGSNTEYTISYSLERGMDSSREIGIRRDRVAYIENMYRDYEGRNGASLESIPGYRKLLSFDGKINALHSQRVNDGTTQVIIHSGDKFHWRTYKNNEFIGELELTTVPDRKSVSFNFVDSLYILDGEDIHRFKKEEEYTSTQTENLTPYIPTTHINGAEYEGRNILTDEFIEEITLANIDEYSFGSPGIYYKVTDVEQRFCKTIGLSDTQTASNIYIPAYTVIDGVRYKVTEIGEDTFRSRESIKTVTISEGVHTIGKGAFCDCTSLTTVYMPSTLATICENAFLRCASLVTVAFGITLSSLSENAFVSTPEQKNIYYGGKEEDFFKIASTSYIAESYTFNPYYKKEDIYMTLPLTNKTKKVTRVVIDGINRAFDYTSLDGVITALNVTILNRENIEFKTAKIHGEYNEPWQMPKGVLAKNGRSLIAGSTIACEFDGRIFLSGNELARGYVFYSSVAKSEDELYFPTYNYFKEANAGEVVSLLPSMGALLVFTRGDKNGGSIYYHTPTDTGLDMISRIYPVSYVHAGIEALGPSISFYDDPVFLTRGGLYGIDKQKISLERAISSRSHNINAELLGENVKNAMMTIWCGYLMIFIGTRVFLADSRATFLHPSGSYEYEWYMLSGIGSYIGERKRVYKYSDMASPDTRVHSRAGEVTDEVVYSAYDSDGVLYYYTEENGEKYAVYDTGVILSDTIAPPTTLLSLGEDKLIFGTEAGDIYTFNNDQRGVPPSEIKDAPGFDIDEYKAHFDRLIHPTLYSFDGITPRYAIKLPLDDCDIPYLTKSTVNGSLVLKCTYRGAGELTSEVATDKNGYQEVSKLNGGGFDFSSISFDSLSLTTDDLLTIPIMERERGWIEKQIAIYSVGYATPIAIHSVSYRYKIKGKIKKQ